AGGGPARQRRCPAPLRGSDGAGPGGGTMVLQGGQEDLETLHRLRLSAHRARLPDPAADHGRSYPGGGPRWRTSVRPGLQLRGGRRRGPRLRLLPAGGGAGARDGGAGDHRASVRALWPLRGGRHSRRVLP
ncbi:hypothetical protein HispidOSU_027725, partial [Sigmodon hispidus]